MEEEKRVIYPAEDGGVAIIIPAPGVTIDDAIKAVPSGRQYRIINASQIPYDRTFRDAWEFTF